MKQDREKTKQKHPRTKKTVFLPPRLTLLKDAAKKSSRNRIEFVARGADAYQQLVQLLRDDEWKKEDSLSPALYDLGLNHLLRARLVCAEAGEGSGLWPQEDYENIPEAAELAR